MAELPLWEGHNVSHWRALWRAGDLRFLDSVDSTNDIALTLANAGAPHLSIVVAEHQQRGRGRGGSAWNAPHGSSLLLSILFRLSQPAAAPGCAPIRIGIAVADAIADATQTDVMVKWPNDVVIEGHGKIAGVLCEGSVAPDRAGHMVAGIGINVLQGAEEFPAELRGSACSIASATGLRVERAQLLTKVLGRIHEFDERLADVLSDVELSRFAARDALLGREAACEMANGHTVIGTASGIASDGGLLIEQRGEIVRVYNGTVRLAHTQLYPGTRKK